jgi:hypothetical protein
LNSIEGLPVPASPELAPELAFARAPDHHLKKMMWED